MNYHNLEVVCTSNNYYHRILLNSYQPLWVTIMLSSSTSSYIKNLNVPAGSHLFAVGGGILSVNAGDWDRAHVGQANTYLANVVFFKSLDVVWLWCCTMLYLYIYHYNIHIYVYIYITHVILYLFLIGIIVLTWWLLLLLGLARTWGIKGVSISFSRPYI